MLFRLLCNFLVGICALESMGLTLHLIRAPISKTTNLVHATKMFKPLLKECLLLEPCYCMDKLACISGTFMHKFQYLTFCFLFSSNWVRGELSYLAPLGSENISAPYFKQCFFRRGGVLPPIQSNTTPPSPKTEITNILFYILNFASIIKFKM